MFLYELSVTLRNLYRMNSSCFYSLPATSFLCQNQEEEKPVWEGCVRGGDGGRRVTSYDKVSQFLQPQVGRKAHVVRTGSFPPVWLQRSISTVQSE